LQPFSSPPDGRPENLEADRRLALYRRAARALAAFYARFTAPFCGDCLEVTRRHHRTDPRADVDLVHGQFPGCCHAGVGDALWVPRSGDEGRFPPELAQAMERAREGLAACRGKAGRYAVRERRTGTVATGVGCGHLGPKGCRLGELKGPLCISYLCEPVREALAAAVGWDLLGQDTDDFGGALKALRAVICAGLVEAEAEVARMEAGLRAMEGRLSSREAATGETAYGRYRSSENGSNPSAFTR